MPLLIERISTRLSPESLVEQLAGKPGVILLRSGVVDRERGRYSLVVARPFLTLRTFGSSCELRSGESCTVQDANPWHLLESLLTRFEQVEDLDLDIPAGGCFGYWGYDLKNFVEPVLPRNAPNDLGLPDCHLGFYDSLVAFDHESTQTWIISTGFSADGSRSTARAEAQIGFWRELLARTPASSSAGQGQLILQCQTVSNMSRANFVTRVERCQTLIRSGAIYQVNLSHRLAAACPLSGWDLFLRLSEASPAPYAAFMDCGDFQLVSSSPELFLKISGRRICTRPIKGTRPRSQDPIRDEHLDRELQSSPKERAELIMITDLLRNDLGKVCEFGSVQVPELFRVERYAHVRHLVSTVEGRLRPDVTHASALAACFPGGSITGAPKIQAMKIIDELETVARGPYTGALGYLGLNQQSQLSIVIRAAIVRGSEAWFHVGAGIVADSDPAAEYAETLAKGAGFFEAIGVSPPAEQDAGDIAVPTRRSQP